ncbi:MAG: DUF86 domain-containing protein [Gemmatimonadota bacterium]
MSAQRDDWVYVRHIRDAARRIESYVDGVAEADFFEATLVQDGVIRQLQVIGEAAKRLSSEFRSKAAQVPWSDITGMRDKLVHDYMGVDLEAVWDTAIRDVPALLSQLEALDWPDEGSNSA